MAYSVLKLKKKLAGKGAGDLFLLPGIILAGLAVFVLLWEFSPLSGYASPAKIAALADSFRQYPAAPFYMIGIIVAGQLLFFPLMVMTIATAMVFGPLEGIFISVTGGIIGAALTYGVGLGLGKYGLRKYMGPVCAKVRGYIDNTGLLGMIALRYVPFAPYSVVNIALGVLSAPVFIFLAGSFLALLPGAVIRSFLGDAVMELWQHPDPESLSYVGAGVLAWITVVVVAHFLVRRGYGTR